jgi:hypothetical protein
VGEESEGKIETKVGLVMYRLAAELKSLPASELEILVAGADAHAATVKAVIAESSTFTGFISQPSQLM